MEIKCLASSSSGNCYVITNAAGDSSLMIEAGLPAKEIIKRLATLSLSLSKISAVVITHGHGDHARGAKDLSETYGKVIMSGPETLTEAGVITHRWPLFPWKSATTPSWNITPFDVDHDFKGSLGFIIEERESGELLLFINDTGFVKYNLSSWAFDFVMIECNHTVERLLANADPTVIRKAQSHMSLTTTKETVSKLNLERCKRIYLMHLSDGNSDEPRMIAEIEKATGKPVVACQKNGGIK